MKAVRGETGFLKEYVIPRSPGDVGASPVQRRALEGSIHVIEAVLDVCRHIVSVKGWGPALSYADYVRLCSEHGVITPGLPDRLVGYVRLWNIIIHGYLEVDYGELHGEAHELIGVAGEFERRIQAYLRRELEDAD